MNDFRGKLAFVTGGSAGVGKAIAKSLAAQGADTIIFSRSHAKLMATLKELQAVRVDHGQKLTARVVDVTRERQVCQVMAEELARCGAPHYLFNCATCEQAGSLGELPLLQFRRMMDVNYFGVLHVCKTVAAALARERRGHIVNMLSVAAEIVLDGHTGIRASNHAVLGFSQALRSELQPYQVRVSLLCFSSSREMARGNNENSGNPGGAKARDDEHRHLATDCAARKTLSVLDRDEFLVWSGSDPCPQLVEAISTPHGIFTSGAA